MVYSLWHKLCLMLRFFKQGMSVLITSRIQGGHNMPSLSPFPYIQPSVDQSIRQQLIESSRLEYGRLYDLLAFASPEQLAAASAERHELLQWLDQHASFGYAGTKVNCTGLSPDCRRSGDDMHLWLYTNGFPKRLHADRSAAAHEPCLFH